MAIRECKTRQRRAVRLAYSREWLQGVNTAWLQFGINIGTVQDSKVYTNADEDLFNNKRRALWKEVCILTLLIPEAIQAHLRTLYMPCVQVRIYKQINHKFRSACRPNYGISDPHFASFTWKDETHMDSNRPTGCIRHRDSVSPTPTSTGIVYSPRPDLRNTAIFSISHLQNLTYWEEKIKELLLVIRSDIKIIIDVKQYYQDLTSSPEFPDDIETRSMTKLKDFQVAVASIVNDLEMQYSRADMLL
ncbi:hypothetical protein BDZ45DRAFT_808336 [Acephala macrosclerotiorum]|nr:hypothetical protein BDZ45DRAFT_808336 [Acephala macrosclerotiorum]